MTIISSPYPFIFVNGTVADATQVNADFNYVQSQVNSNAAANGVNSDITQLTALTNFTSTNGTITNTLTANIINASGVCAFASDIHMTGTGALEIPSGTTAQRPGSPIVGDIRYNNTTNTFEGYGGVSPSWAAFGSVTGFPISVGLKVNNNTGTPNTKIDVTCALAQMVTSTNIGIIRSLVAVTIDATTVGANGLDVGSLAASTWYYVWLIDNGSTTAGLVSLSSTAPALPSGYTFQSRVGAIITDGSSHFLQFISKGAETQFVVSGSGNTTNYPVLVTVTVTGFVVTAFSIASGIPPTATKATVKNTSGVTTVLSNSTLNSTFYSGTQTNSTVLETYGLFYSSNSSGDTIRSVGWRDSIVAF